jgi:predicted NAD-dependent protein-ADP-ribosyltransferase YbiA (DUF1768 family)
MARTKQTARIIRGPKMEFDYKNNSWLSNKFPSVIRIDGLDEPFATAEHYYQYSKYSAVDSDYSQQLLGHGYDASEIEIQGSWQAYAGWRFTECAENKEVDSARYPFTAGGEVDIDRLGAEIKALMATYRREEPAEEEAGKEKEKVEEEASTFSDEELMMIRVLLAKFYTHGDLRDQLIALPEHTEFQFDPKTLVAAGSQTHRQFWGGESNRLGELMQMIKSLAPHLRDKINDASQVPKVLSLSEQEFDQLQGEWSLLSDVVR